MLAMAVEHLLCVAAKDACQAPAPQYMSAHALLPCPTAHRASDVQVELVMLDPYVRTTLSHDGAGRFSTQVGRLGARWGGGQARHARRRARAQQCTCALTWDSIHAASKLRTHHNGACAL